MSKYDVPTTGDTWQHLRQQLSELSQLAGAPSANLVTLAKLYEGVAKTLWHLAREHGLSSLRLQAAAKALDLATPKSALERFVGPAESPPGTE